MSYIKNVFIEYSNISCMYYMYNGHFPASPLTIAIEMMHVCLQVKY